MSRRNQEFQTIRSEGGLLPPDLLRRVIDPRASLKGTSPEDYGLPQGERLNEVITQSWNRLRRHWGEFRATAAKLPEGEAATGLTNDKWSLPLLRELSFGLLPTSASPEIAGRTYAISRFFGSVPIHLVGCGLSLDRRAAGVRGAAGGNPHGLVQEVLNRSPDHLWGIVGNGLRLRILRDNQALSRQSFLEFDLEAMFSAEAYSDFVLLWLVAHATRFAPRDGARIESCWLEDWTKEAQEQGTRALKDLRGSVERALQVLGEGFTSHPKNTALREALRSGSLPLADFHGRLLRVVYRLIFLFVAEDRTLEGQALLHARDDSEAARVARERYANHYGTSRLRELAGKIKGSRHGDLWRQFQILVGALSGEPAFEDTRRSLALPALGSFLWSPGATGALNAAELTNHDFLEALRHLAYTRQGKVLRPVDYRNLGAEELGGVYESLLALTPQISADGARFTFAEFAGNERKTSGSYYTPDSLVQCLLDSALDPVVEEAIKSKIGAEAEQAILGLKVCDPAVGSGHFLVGAAHRLARHLSRVRAQAQGESEPSPLLYQHALRDVIGRCLYGVDINAMAAELCRVSLWLEALDPGKPLSFLDHHIRVGNSLLSTSPELIARGLPDEAYDPIEGDDKKVCAALKKRNRQERDGGQANLDLQMAAEPRSEYDTLTSQSQSIDQATDDSLEAIRRKAEQFQRLVVSPEYRHRQQLADAWCAAFVWPKQAAAPAEPITTDTIRRLDADASALSLAQRVELERLAGQYQFFHWPLAFPEVFAQGGFDCVLGNPPWERIKLQEKEWFGNKSAEVASARTASERRARIAALKTNNNPLYHEFTAALRTADAEAHLIRGSARFPLTSHGDINTYSIFAELFLSIIRVSGRMGIICPSGIATDSSNEQFFGFLMTEARLVSLFDFQNSEGLFPEVYWRMKFSLLTATGPGRASSNAQFIFYATNVAQLHDAARRYELTAADLRILNPGTMTCPILRDVRDRNLLIRLYRVGRPVIPANATKDDWNLKLFRMFGTSSHSHLFLSEQSSVIESASDTWDHQKIAQDTVFLKLYEGKMFNLYNHRFAHSVTTDNVLRPGQPELIPDAMLDDPFLTARSRQWVALDEFRGMSNGFLRNSWLLAFKKITSPLNERTVLAAVLPGVPTNDSVHLVLPKTASSLKWLASFLGNVCSFVFDYSARCKLGGNNLNFYVFESLPVIGVGAVASLAPWDGNLLLGDWMSRRVLELTYVAWDLEAFAQDCGWPGPPFRWNDERRFWLQCELDAAFFSLYLPTGADGGWALATGETPEERARLKEEFRRPRDAVEYIMERFPIVRRKDEEKFNGDYRTKRVILEIYDAMQEAIRTGLPYQTRLDPPSADPSCSHPPRST